MTSQAVAMIKHIHSEMPYKLGNLINYGFAEKSLKLPPPLGLFLFISLL